MIESYQPQLCEALTSGVGGSDHCDDNEGVSGV